MQLKQTSLKTVREQAAKTIMGLQDGSVSPLIADAIYKQSITIVDSYRVELRAIELAISTTANKSAPITFDQAAKLIAKVELATSKWFVMYKYYFHNHIVKWSNPKSIQVVYDKGRDNDATLRSKLVSAYRKTGTDLSNLNSDLQYLKKHKSIQIYY